MSQCDFFIEDKDFENIVSFFLERSCSLVPDLDYEEPKLKTFKSLDEITETRKTKMCALFFVIHDEWLEMPLNFSEIKKDGRTVYFIPQRDGGPSIHLFSPLEYKNANRAFLPHGFLGLYKSYWNYKTETFVENPEKIKAAYKVALKFMKTNSKRIRTRKRAYFVCQNALRRTSSTLFLGAPFDELTQPHLKD
ncbi:hypothetical protein [Acanthopleuribacter pedis]|uniref:Uncharacterized protein n=1 Tax=Acanthopleuribacter pedis TaxID=442870 RepID=A0A8J7U321_9BACT|nr:hypothetical protein [Acanthopleuribacter pedis]MBO1316821.1 hypothetical protein [Acanthopleuribacter pedis]